MKLKRILKYIIKLFCLILPLLVFTYQSQGQDVIVTDSIPKSRMIAPTMFRAGMDLLGLAHSAINDRRDAWEVQADVDIYRYFISAELGGEFNIYTEENYNYQSNGTYWRIGADINMIPREPNGSVLFFGLRYANGIYDEKLSGTINDPVWGEVMLNSENQNVRASWIEVVAGMKAKIWKNLYMGYILRLKASLKVKDEEQLNVEPYRIPGYGLANQNTFYGLNYYVAWQFPFKQKYAAVKRL